MKSWAIYNPRNGEKLKEYSFSSSEEVFEAIDKLHLGFQKWKILSFRERQAALDKVLELVEKDQKRLAQTISDEMGKSVEQAEAEVKKCLSSAKYLCRSDFKGLDTKIIPNKTYSESKVVIEPLGVILSILPWNYPAWQGFRAFFPNLLAGNTILLKHSEKTPTTGDLIQSYFEQAGLGDILKHRLFEHEMTEAIIRDFRIGGASITGSVSAGKVIAETCARHFKKSVLELGGSDPAIILEDANYEKSCQSIAKSRLQNAGQVCISIKRVLVPHKHAAKILEKMKWAFLEVLNSKIELVGPLAGARFRDEYNKTIRSLKEQGEVVFEFDMNLKNVNENSAYVNPCILYFKKNLEILKTTEVFGPGLIIIPYESVEEALEVANSTIFGLGASVYGKNIEDCHQVASKLIAGQVSINASVRSDVCLPFGGFKSSGYGREVGEQGFLEFTQTKVVSVHVE